MSGLFMRELEGAVANGECREGGEGTRTDRAGTRWPCLSMVAYCGEYITIRTYEDNLHGDVSEHGGHRQTGQRGAGTG